jgi:DNA invertase Pin-like site-specific DNA recombinase
MSALLVGYARCSTDTQDLSAQRDGLAKLGVATERIYVDHGLTGTNRERPGLREASAARRAGDTLVVTKLDRLARSLPDARAIADELTARQVRLNLGGSVYDPTDAVGRLLFNVLAMVAEFEADLIRLRTREGMKVAKAKGHLRGKQPKLNRRQGGPPPSRSCTAANTAPLRWQTCSAWPARPSTVPSSDSDTRPRSTPAQPPRSAECQRTRRPARQTPCGTPAALPRTTPVVAVSPSATGTVFRRPLTAPWA